MGTLLQPPPLVGTSVRLVETPPRARSEGMESISLVSEVFRLQLQEELGSQRLFGLSIDRRMADSISSLSK